MTKPNENRLGKFYISDSLMEKNLDAVRDILKDVIVVRAEHLYHRGEFEYYGYHPQFDDIPDGPTCPEYTSIIETHTEPAKKEDIDMVDLVYTRSQARWEKRPSASFPPFKLAHPGSLELNVKTKIVHTVTWVRVKK